MVKPKKHKIKNQIVLELTTTEPGQVCENPYLSYFNKNKTAYNIIPL
jgi:hypothetical protein